LSSSVKLITKISRFILKYQNQFRLTTSSASKDPTQKLKYQNRLRLTTLSASKDPTQCKIFVQGLCLLMMS